MPVRMEKSQLHEATSGICKEIHANETGKRKAENTSPDQSTSSANTPIEGDETNLVNRFNRQLRINAETPMRPTVENLIRNPQMAQTDEERAKLREIQYYAEAAERAEIDTIKADPKEEEFLQTLE
jgi:hypothetical protein